MNYLYGRFPRQVAIPYRINVKNKEEFYKFINQHNGKRRIFTTLYNYANGSQKEKIMVDKVWFDLDSGNSFENLKKLHTWAKEKNYKHLMVFSGGGFHFYLLTKDYKDLENPKFALRSAQQTIAAEVGLTIGRPDKADIDEHIIGDIARVVTVVNTFNVKRRRYCIPLTEEDIEKGADFIRQKAAKQVLDLHWYGKKLFSMKEFDGAPQLGKIEELDMETQNRISRDTDLKKLPPCIAAKFLDDYISFRERFHIYSWMRDLGYTVDEVKQFVKKYWSHIDGGPTARNLADYIIKNRQIESVFIRDDILAASCETLRYEGMCVKRVCKWKDKLYL